MDVHDKFYNVGVNPNRRKFRLPFGEALRRYDRVHGFPQNWKYDPAKSGSHSFIASVVCGLAWRHTIFPDEFMMPISFQSSGWAW